LELKNKYMFKNLGKNWKTNLAGVGALISGLAQVFTGHLNEGIGTIIAAIGLFSAKDHNQ
jgi:hypothetical protein